MYTGIVQGSYAIQHVERKSGLHTLSIDLPEKLLQGLDIGASVGVDGVCLTVTTIEDCRVSFDVMQQTLSLTTLGGLNEGDRVNIERSAKQGVEIGGHILSGHIDGCVEIVAVEVPENNRFISYRAPSEKMKYIFQKGFIGLNGCSLTVASVDRAANSFKVCFIPETLRVTTHQEKQLGDKVNFEIDRQTQAIVDTVENFLDANPELLGAK
ncbi:MAG: riboflavin synthase subunit alpha [Pseudomonadales bacterium]